MAKSGKQLAISIGGGIEVIGQIVNGDLTNEANEVDGSAGHGATLGGYTSYSLEGLARFDDQDAGQLLLVAGDEGVSASYRPFGTGVGLPHYQGVYTVVQWNISVSADSAVDITFRLASDGSQELLDTTPQT